jgi:HSP20 family protein
MTNLMTVESPMAILNDLAGLRGEFNRLFADRGTTWDALEFPQMNTWVGDSDVVIDVELPGVEPKDVDIAIAGNELTVSGKRTAEPVADNEVAQRQELPFGEFSRTIELPYEVDATATKAKYHNGVLRITAPRTGSEKPRKIQIEVA